jgi:hypothetical protein
MLILTMFRIVEEAAYVQVQLVLSTHKFKMKNQKSLNHLPQKNKQKALLLKKHF